MAATKQQLFEQIRRDSWREGPSIRALARKYHVHRRLVREVSGGCGVRRPVVPGRERARARGRGGGAGE